MALTPQSRASQTTVRSTVEVTSPEASLTQTITRAITQIATQEAAISQAAVRTLAVDTTDLNMSQTVVRTIVKGRVDDPVVRAWTFTLDGHDFYVLRLGNDETLVYDVATEQWYVWGSSDTKLWRAYNGHNWLAADNQARDYGSNIFVGDDGNGALYFLDPDGDTDDDAIEGSSVSRPFTRKITGQVTNKGYNSAKVYGVYLEGSLADLPDDVSLATVNLSYSDDRGVTYNDAGDVTLVDGDNNVRAVWRSLGSLKMPGRLFQITDTGSLKRIDYLDASLGD